MVKKQNIKIHTHTFNLKGIQTTGQSFSYGSLTHSGRTPHLEKCLNWNFVTHYGNPSTPQSAMHRGDVCFSKYNGRAPQGRDCPLVQRAMGTKVQQVTKRNPGIREAELNLELCSSLFAPWVASNDPLSGMGWPCAHRGTSSPSFWPELEKVMLRNKLFGSALL